MSSRTPASSRLSTVELWTPPRVIVHTIVSDECAFTRSRWGGDRGVRTRGKDGSKVVGFEVPILLGEGVGVTRTHRRTRTHARARPSLGR